MGMYDKIKDLCIGKGITITQLEKALNFGRGSISKIDIHKPSLKRIELIADYFGISANYFLNNTQETNAQTPEEIKLLESFRTLNDTGKEKLLDYLTDLLDNPKYTGKKSLISEVG